ERQPCPNNDICTAPYAHDSGSKRSDPAWLAVSYPAASLKNGAAMKEIRHPGGCLSFELYSRFCSAQKSLTSRSASSRLLPYFSCNTPHIFCALPLTWAISSSVRSPHFSLTEPLICSHFPCAM